MSIMDVMHHITGRFRQLSAIFGSYDYQMKGEDYIDQSPWPINWKQNMEGILRHSMFGKISCFWDVLDGCCRKRITDFTHWNHFLWIKILHPEAWMIHNNTKKITRIDQNRLLQILLWSRFHGFPEAAGAAVRALAGPPCSQRCAAVSNSG